MNALHFTVDGDYPQIKDLKTMIRELHIVKQKWSAGCSLFQNALDKAKSYMLLKAIVDKIKSYGFHQHETPPRCYDRLKSFASKIFSKASVKTIDIFFSYTLNMIQSIFRHAIIQEGFTFTGFGDLFSLDIILGQLADYKFWPDDKRDTFHELFWQCHFSSKQR